MSLLQREIFGKTREELLEKLQESKEKIVIGFKTLMESAIPEPVYKLNELIEDLDQEIDFYRKADGSRLKKELKNVLDKTHKIFGKKKTRSAGADVWAVEATWNETVDIDKPQKKREISTTQPSSPVPVPQSVTNLGTSSLPRNHMPVVKPSILDEKKEIIFNKREALLSKKNSEPVFVPPPNIILGRRDESTLKKDNSDTQGGLSD